MRKNGDIVEENYRLKLFLGRELKKRKKEFYILLKTIQDLNKVIKKDKKQIDFLNELLDEREREIKDLERGQP